MPFKSIEAKREYQRQLMALRRAKLKGLTNGVSPDANPKSVRPVLDPKAEVSPDIIVRPSKLDPVSPEINIKLLDPSIGEPVRPINRLDPDNYVSPESEALDPDLVRPEPNPLNSVSPDLEKKLDPNLEAYNAEVYKRASVLTKDPEAFFTFPDGRKIIRTVCGCNPTTKAFYT
jgi:hypothetical protein